MAGVSGGNLWSRESRAASLWSNMFLQTNTTDAQTVSAEIGNFNWSAPNMSAESLDNVTTSVGNDLFATAQEVGESSSLLESMGAFATHGLSDGQPWNQTLLRSQGSEPVQNMQTSLENLSEALFCKQKELMTLPTDHWEMRNFAGEETSFPNLTKENGFHHLLDDRLNINSTALSDLESSTLQTPDHNLTRSVSAVNSYNNSLLQMPMPQFDIARIKHECSMLDTPPSIISTLSQGLESDTYSKQHIPDILDSSANRSFIKAMAGHCYNNNNGQAFMEDQYPGLWPSSNSNTHPRFPAALSHELLPTSSQPASLLNTHRNSPLWDLICPKPQQFQNVHTFPQFLQERKLQMNSMTQHLNMSHLEEARDSCSNDTRKCTNENCTSDTIFKRPRLDSTNTVMPTFKVRKEKLGDRITALQQLVSPFGKTDTASVLLEAIGYIKFLHEQVQVLSTPYMNNAAAPQGDQTTWAGSPESKDSDEPKQDLRSRGLCLVPVSTTLTVTNDTATDYWNPPFGINYR